MMRAALIGSVYTAVVAGDILVPANLQRYVHCKPGIPWLFYVETELDTGAQAVGFV